MMVFIFGIMGGIGVVFYWVLVEYDGVDFVVVGCIVFEGV